MGILSWLLGTDSTADIAEAVTPPYPSVTDLVNAYVAARMAGAPFVNPALERGVELIASAVAQLAPVVYRDGQAMEDQPRIVSRPDPWSTRYDFLHQTARSMVEEGDAHWFLFDHDPDTNRPRAARVVPVGEVEVGWDDLHWLPTYRWRGKLMRHGYDWRHIRLAPRAGELLGRSPVKACARALLGIEAAELYAAGYFGGSGAVSGVLQVPGELEDGEADELKQQWMEAHSTPVPTPAVLSGGITWTPDHGDPDKSQLVETRELGVATVARLLGIPAPLLLVSTAGTSLTYSNVSQLYTELIRATVAPLYLAPIEAALSDLVPRTSSVQFSLGELTRLDVKGRWDVYQQAAALGVIDAEGIARLEGFGPTSIPTHFVPTPAPGGVTSPEVPA